MYYIQFTPVDSISAEKISGIWPEYGVIWYSKLAKYDQNI